MPTLTADAAVVAAAPTPAEPAAVATASPLAAVEATAAVVAAAETPALPVPSPQATPAVDPAAFWDKLGASDNRVGALTATDELLAAWSAEPLNQEERQKSSVDLWAIAGKRGLRYLPMSGNLTRLQMLNLPAILEIAVPDSQRRRFALLTGVEDGRVLLRYDGAAVTLSNEEIARLWLGEAHVFWRDFLDLSPYMAPGTVGEDVMKLQQMLARVGEYQGSFSSRYDRSTSEAIARFQRSRRLTADGVVGPLTKILLYEAVGSFDHPRLSDAT